MDLSLTYNRRFITSMIFIIESFELSDISYNDLFLMPKSRAFQRLFLNLKAPFGIFFYDGNNSLMSFTTEKKCSVKFYYCNNISQF